MNVPRITSKPSSLAIAANPTKSTMAARTRIWAVVSWSLSRSRLMRKECSAPRTAPKTTTASTASAPRSKSVDPTPPSPEKKRVSRMIAPKSAIDAAATMSWPKGDEISPVSFSTGTITPSEVAQRMIATSSGVWTSPAADSPKPTTTAIAKETMNASAVRRRIWPRSFSNSISRPARNSTKPSPINASTSMVWSTSTMPSNDGPTTMPATISSTTDGNRTRGNRPSRNGAAKATATTIRRSLKDGMRQNAASAGRRRTTGSTPRRCINWQAVADGSCAVVGSGREPLRRNHLLRRETSCPARDNAWPVTRPRRVLGAYGLSLASDRAREVLDGD